MTRRRLRPEELELWKKVADQAEALHPTQTFDAQIHAPKPVVKKMEKRASITLDGKTPPKPEARRSSYDLVPNLPERLQQTAVQMDRKTFGKMSRGKLKPEARIDLHGMTLDRAHAALTRFIFSAYGSEKRLVLVITGKGKNRDEGGPIPVRHGVLRHQAPQWLATAPLASMVLQVSQSHARHGGGGAYYVYLKRKR